MKLITSLAIVCIFNAFLYSDILEFEAYIKKEIADKTPPSASFTILHNNNILYTKSLGYNDAKMQQKTKADSVYHVYSLSKILTATLVIQLIEEKKLHLHDPITKYFPNFDARYNGKPVTLTLLHLLNHSSGISDNSDVRHMMGEQKTSTYLDLPYLPGTEAKYSNSEYIILSKIVERVSHKSFATLINSYILKPSSMTHSDFTYNDKTVNNQVYGTIQFFSLTGTIMRFILDEKNQDFYEGSMLWLKEFDIQWQAAGGLVSSIDDMATFLSAYHANKLFNAHSKKVFLHTPTVKVNSWMSTQEDVRFGIGWYHIRDKGKHFYQHQGLGPGFRTIIRIYPKYNISIIILTSQTSIDIDNWADKLIEHSLDEMQNNSHLF